MSLVRVIGKGLLRINLMRVKRAITKETGKAMFQHGMFVMSKAIPITPIDLGNLRASWFVNKPVNGPEGPTVTIGFTMSYAEKVHNDPKAFHDAPTRFNFLSDPVNKSRKRFEKAIKSAAFQALKKSRRRLK